MKTLFAILATATLLQGGTQRAAAGDREWATAGKILTGVVAGAVIATPVYVQPAPVVVYSTPICVRLAPVVVVGPPRPVVSFSVGFGGGIHHRSHHRICR